MYPEFVALYVIGAVIIAMLAVVIALAFMILKKGPSQNYGSDYSQYYQPQQQYQMPPQNNYGGVVFCSNCANQYNASQPYCPKCGTPR